MLKIKQKDIDRFWSKVQKTRKCWNWIGGCFTRDGYGQIGICGQMRRSHRISWIIHFGKIPNKLYVLHKCNNRKCIRPDHLYLGTQFENMRDAILAGNLSPKGEKNGRSRISERDVLMIRDLYKNFHWKQKQLAELFKIGRSTISHIIRNFTWSHVH